MQQIQTYPAFLDFIQPRMGHSFSVNKEVGKFGDRFKLLEATIHYDPLMVDIRKGDVIYSKLQNGYIGMFRIVSIYEDKEVEEVLYCDVVLCGYKMETPAYFRGFTEEWNKKYPPKVLTENSKPVPKQQQSFWDKHSITIVGCTVWVAIIGLISICAIMMSVAASR